MFNISFKRKKTKRNLLDIESILQSSLKPISPRPEFIQGLHRGLMDYTFPQSESSDFDLKKSALFALLGFISLVFFLSLWIRLVVVIISAVGMLQASKRKKEAT